MESITKETRRESYYAVLPTLTARQKTVLQILKTGGDMTAQEIAAELHRRGITPTDERNFSAPRLTELADMGLVKAVNKKICGKTGKTVSVWSADVEEK
jgi:predicted ArsR family transcriptional regulator